MSDVLFIQAWDGARVTGSGRTLRDAYPGLTTRAHRLYRPDASELVPEARTEAAGPVVIVARSGTHWGAEGRPYPTSGDLGALVGAVERKRRRA